MKKRKKTTPEERAAERARRDDLTRRLRDRIERAGGRVPETRADSDRLTRLLRERIEGRATTSRDDEPGRPS